MLGSAERSVKVTGTGVAAQQQEMQNGSGNLQIAKVDVWAFGLMPRYEEYMYKKCVENSTQSTQQPVEFVAIRDAPAHFEQSFRSLINYVRSATWMNVNGMEWNEKSGETVAEERQKECMHGYCGLQRKKDRKCARTNYRQISHGNCNWSIIHSN